jgi:DNA-binding NtrC family response regulator
VTPPRFPLGPSEALAVAYAVGILRALADASGNHQQAAEALGVSRRTMDDHIARLGMSDLQSALWPRSVRQPKRRDQQG